MLLLKLPQLLIVQQINLISRYLLKKTPHSDTVARASVASGYVSKYSLTLKDGVGVASVNTDGNSAKDQADIKLDSVDNIKVGMTVTGHANLPSLVKVKSINTGTKTVTLTANITSSQIPSDTGLKFMGNIWWDYKKDVTNGDLTTFKAALDQNGPSGTGAISRDPNTNFRVYFFPTSQTNLDGAVNRDQKVIKVKKQGGYQILK